MGDRGGQHQAYQAHKRQELDILRGRVLEIGAGKGRSLDQLHPGVCWQGLEPDRRRHTRLVRLAQNRPHALEPLRASAEEIPLPDESVDGVLSVVTLCSVDDADRVLSEIHRVLRPGGQFVFAEHVAAPEGTWTRRALGVVSPLSRRFDHGCDPLRDTVATVRRSRLELDDLERFELPHAPRLRIPYVVGVAVR